MIQIVPVETELLQQQFLQLPRKLYCDNPFWISPSESSESELAGFSDHPFYLQAASRAFLAFDSKDPVGRILAIDHQLYREWNQESVGYFGFFECIDDQSVATALFSAASQWLGERDVSTIRGPIQASLNYSCGCLVDKFDHPPVFGMPYNSHWYPDLIEGCDFEIARDLLSYSGHIDMLSDLDPKFERTARQAQDRFGIRLRHFDMAHFERDMRLYFEIFNQTLPQQWGAVPVTESEVVQMVKDYRQITVDRFTAFAEIEGRPIGVVYGFPDLNPLFQHLGNGTLPKDWIDQPNLRAQIQRVRIAVALVKPEYNRWGIGPLMNWFLLEQVLADTNWNKTLKEVEYAWILDNNELSRGTMERGGARRSRTHRIYAREI